jgi:hypothetical protein
MNMNMNMNMNIFPLSYSIPYEYVLNEIPEKKILISSMIPNFHTNKIYQ